MGEQVFFAVDAVAVGEPVLVLVMVVVTVLVRLVRRYLARVYVQTVLTLFRESNQERDEIVHDRVRYVFGQPFLFHAVLVQRGHEIRQRLRHPELNFQLSAGKHQWILNLKKKKNNVFNICITLYEKCYASIIYTNLMNNIIYTYFTYTGQSLNFCT